MTTTVADAIEIITLWPDGPPTTIEGVPPEEEFPVAAGVAAGTTFLRNISEPTLSVFAPQGSGNGLGVIVVPGGGWTINAWTHEGFDVVGWLTEPGYTACILKYRVRATDPGRMAFAGEQADLDAALAAGWRRGDCRGPSAISLALAQNSKPPTSRPGRPAPTMAARPSRSSVSRPGDSA